MKDDPNSRFNRLLRAMLGGPAPSQKANSNGNEAGTDAIPRDDGDKKTQSRDGE
jgi:hypothetical protein